LRTFNLAFQKLAALWWTLGNNLGRFNVFEIDLPQIWFKCVFDFKSMDFENVTLTKIVHIYVIEGMNT
jgi:hypothetical protein